MDSRKTGLYIITYNAPGQLRMLIDSLSSYDSDFLTQTQKFVLDNSDDPSTFDEYVQICQEHGFTHLKKNNIGITGGRRFIAQHAHEQDISGYFFFEDDMLMHSEQVVCDNGYDSIRLGLYGKIVAASETLGLDYVKMSYTEISGDNSIQWAWYSYRWKEKKVLWPEKYAEYQDKNIQWPDIKDLPKTKFTGKGSYADLEFLEGELYYCNWPHYINKKANQKIFIDTGTTNYSEKYYCGFGFEKAKRNEIRSVVLLLSPINHYRKFNYKREDRVEYLTGSK